MSKPQATPEVLRSITASLLATLAVATGACLSPDGGEKTTDVNLTGETGGSASSSSSGASGGSTLDGIMTTTDDPDTTTTAQSESSGSSTSEGTSGSTTGTPIGCGDGVINGDEECDDEDSNADDAACTSKCRLAKCGDMLVQKGVEVCDDGLNDGAYGGCAADCKDLAPYCGDAKIQDAYEACDDPNPKTGCVASTCKFARSCKEIRDGAPDDPEVIDGVYTIKPLDEKINVLCDMDADGGGYTFLKVALAEPGVKSNAEQAEAECKKYGMHLLVPRSPDHATAAVAMAMSTALVPVGGGQTKSKLDYMSLLGIYPVKENESCVGMPLNSDMCKQWKATGTTFWVTDTPINGQPGTKNCLKCSNAYYWKGDGSLDYYETFYNGGTGPETYRFMCDVGDKLP